MTRALAIIVLGWCVLCAPTAVAEPTVGPGEPAGVVLAQNAPPGPDIQQDPAQGPSRDRVAIGVAGIVLIALVLVSRRIRKKPVLFFHWKK